MHKYLIIVSDGSRHIARTAQKLSVGQFFGLTGIVIEVLS